MIGDGEVDCGGRVGSNNMYKRSAEPVLVSLSDLYPDDERILDR